MKKDLLYEEQNEVNESYHPMLKVNLYGSEVSAVVDSGSDICAINEELYLKVKEGKDIPELPVQGVRVIGAIGAKSNLIRSQAMLTVKIQGRRFDVNMMIVRGLCVEMILGVNWLIANCVVVDFTRGSVKVRTGDGEGELFFEGCAAPRDKRNEVHVKMLKDNINSSDEYGFGIAGSSDNGVGTDIHEEAEGDCMIFSEEEILANEVDESTGLGLCKFLLALTTSQESVYDMIDEKVNKLEEVGYDEREALRRLLRKHIKVFSDRPGLRKDYVHRFEVREHRPFKLRPYHIPVAKREAVDKEIRRMLEWEIIERSQSSYSSPLVLVMKKDGTVRITLDARAINKIIVPQLDRPEMLEELVQRFNNIQIMTSIDLTASFWQIPLAEECKKYTAFVYMGRSYHFNVVPFGLNISVSAFIRMLDSVLGDELLSKVTCYVDDVLIPARSWSEHNAVLGEVLKAFSEGNITINLKKSEFGRKEVKFLGHIITADGIRPNPDKIKAIREAPEPKNKKQIKAFLGLCNFFRRFANNQAMNAPALLELIRKNTPWVWSEKCKQEFQEIKQTLCECVRLAHPDWSKDICVATDSSDYGIAAEVFQVIEREGGTERRTISFASRILNKWERQYSITEKEALAIVWAFKKFRTYLLGRKVIVYTDHKALTFLQDCRLTHTRLTRWAILLQEYVFEIRYQPGGENLVADALSRLPIGMDGEDFKENSGKDIRILVMKNVPFEGYVRKTLKEMRREQNADEILKMIKTNWGKRDEVKLHKYYTIKDGILFRRVNPETNDWKICLPEQVIDNFVQYVHLAYGHFGPKKCANKLKETCIFNNMEKRVRKILEKCELCQKTKVSNQQTKGLLYSIVPSEVLEMVAVDLYGCLPTTTGGFNYIMVAVDVVSKYVRLYPLRKSTGKAVAKVMKDFFRTVGKPLKILSDNGPQFVSKAWKSMMEEENITPIYISKYHPSSNIAERIMREIGRLFRAYCAKRHSSWGRYVKEFEKIMNELPHSTTELSPYEVMFGEKPKNIIDEMVAFPPRTQMTLGEIRSLAWERLKEKADRRQEKYNQGRTARVFNVGNLVLVRSRMKSSKINSEIKKFYEIYEGPYKIIRIAHENAMELATPVTNKSKGVYNVVDIKHFRQ